MAENDAGDKKDDKVAALEDAVANISNATAPEEKKSSSGAIEVISAEETPDWLADADEEFEAWFEGDDEPELWEEHEIFAADFDDDEIEDDVSLLSGTNAATERRMTEASSVIALAEFGLAEGSVHLEADLPEGEIDIGKLVARVVPTSPLLGLLDSDWLRQVGDMGEVVSLKPGETLFSEGDDGDSLFLVLAGGLRVDVETLEDDSETMHVANLRPGDFFGEAALLSTAMRSATVTALTDTVGIDIESEAVLTLVEHQPSVIRLLMRYFRARMAGTVLCASPVFHGCNASARKELLSLFRLREVAPGAMVFRPGDEADGLYLVVSGDLTVLDVDDNECWSLGRGQVYGESALLEAGSFVNGLRADTRAWVLRLPQEDIVDVACWLPSILSHIRPAVPEHVAFTDDSEKQK